MKFSGGIWVCGVIFLVLLPPQPIDGEHYYQNIVEFPPLTMDYRPEVTKITILYALRIARTRKISIDLKEFLDNSKATVEAGAEVITDRLVTLIGPYPKLGEYSKEGIYNVILQAYHSRIIIDDVYRQAFKYGKILEEVEIDARYYQWKLEDVKDTEDNCWKYLTEKRKEWLKQTVDLDRTLRSIELIDANITYECFGDRMISGTTKLVDYLYRAYNAAMYITTLQIDITNDFDRYSVNGRKTSWEAPTGPIHRMMKDTDESLSAIGEGLELLEKARLKANSSTDKMDDVKYWEEVIKKFEEQLAAPPYDELYGGGTAIIDNARTAWEEFKQETTFLREYEPYYHKYKNDIPLFKEEYQSADMERFWTTVNSVYEKYLEVAPVADPDAADNLDPNWAFDMAKPLQKLRVGWDLLDSVAEEIKCHSRTSFWYDLRNASLVKTQRPLDRVFAHFSRTMYQPCRTTDEDIVSRCNINNHEICRPTMPSDSQQRHVKVTRDLSFYRPKWIYSRNKSADDPEKSAGTTCEGERTYVIPLYLCRCGFRLDCGKDLGVELKCVLQENDNFRKQCKGSVGYPCKTLPLAPEKYDESCVTSHCDMARNGCEWDTRVFPKVERDNSGNLMLVNP